MRAIFNFLLKGWLSFHANINPASQHLSIPVHAWLTTKATTGLNPWWAHTHSNPIESTHVLVQLKNGCVNGSCLQSLNFQTDL